MRQQPRHVRRKPPKANGQTASSSVQATFASALQHHQAGRLAEAERLYQQVLAVNRRHADALHLLGVVALQTGRRDHAIGLIQQAVAINPNVAAYHSNLGAVFSERGQLDQAVACYRRAINLEPGFPDAHNNLGTTLREQGKLDDAIACYHKALALKPAYPEAHFNLGISHAKAGRLDDAASCYTQALGLRPNFPEVHDALGNARREQQRLDDAVTCHRTAIELRPSFADAYNNLGGALKDLGRLEEAASCCRRAIELKPDFPEAYSNLGSALAEQGKLTEAIGCYRRAIELKPGFPAAFHNLGTALREQGDPDEAISCFRRAIQLDPNYADAHFGLAMALLSRGDMAEGWREYEWRWQTPQMIRGRRGLPQPQWSGEPAAGQTLLIHAEQGFGDTLQFCRYVTLVKQRGLRTVIEVEQPLVRLLRSLPGADLVVARGEALPPFDLHCPLLSLPLAMQTTLATIPGSEAYLQADPEQAAALRQRLDAMAHQGKRVGLVWAGNPRLHSPALAAVDRRRSIEPHRLAPLLQVPGLHFFSLQKGGPAAPAGFGLTDLMGEMTDFADTAALIANLDLVISVDTAVAHLAAALGKPVWLLDRFDSCWRWLSGRRDSPWYPSMRLYHQTQPNDWDPVLAEVAHDLSAFR